MGQSQSSAEYYFNQVEFQTRWKIGLILNTPVGSFRVVDIKLSTEYKYGLIEPNATSRYYIYYYNGSYINARSAIGYEIIMISNDSRRSAGDCEANPPKYLDDEFTITENHFNIADSEDLLS